MASAASAMHGKAPLKIGNTVQSQYDENSEPFDDRYLNAIGYVPDLALSTAMRNSDIPILSLVQRIEQSPMWIFNWLHLARRLGTPQMMETLMPCASWAIQYIEDVNPENSDKLLDEVQKTNQNEFWKPWIDRYLENRRYRIFPIHRSPTKVPAGKVDPPKGQDGQAARTRTPPN